MLYRTEHPKPQFERENWLNLNGEWQFEIDNSNSGAARNLFDTNEEFSLKINVPFCPESKLSGIGNVDFMNSVWYKRAFEITEKQIGNLTFLHFGAVDYEAIVYINGQKCFTHKGGYVSFCVDITDYIKVGTNIVTVNAIDDTRNRLIPSGKQCEAFGSYGCYYTRTTGIWQTVWLEFVPKIHIEKVKYVTNPSNASVHISAELCGSGTFSAEAFYKGKSVGKNSVASNGGITELNISLSETHLWEVGNGRLYDLVLTYGDDKVNSYFGLRSLQLDGHKFLINGKSVFQRLILDQGYYPDGIYTAPSEKELIADIERSLAMGFNGARLHEKVFEERFLYHCDRLGYIVWGEYPNWGLDHSYADSVYGILPEWLEEIERDFNHPAIVGWCPLNETWDQHGRKQFDDLLALVYKSTKAVDPTRPCIDASGNFHVITDIYDLHDYEQNPELFAKHYEPLGESNMFDFHSAYENRQHYDGKKPFFVSEYGGIRWTDQEGWGYGNAPKTQEEFIERLKSLTDVLLDNKYMFGFCYTQLTDVEQEQNGLYTYERKAKFHAETVRKIISRKAAIED
ncbi:MAG: beta-galactosidase [Oscillospiraceae bacterium]|nr:beta-galactosidase [Oscillospiraceae bacterium]